MKKNYRKIKWKSVLCYVLISAFTLAAFAGIGALFRSDDTKTISPTVFSVGALDENGRYVESDLSIITKDLIECQGLVIEPDFTNTSGTFQVFYYSDRKVFIGSSEVLNAADGIYIKNGDFGTAAYCRIMITPEPPADVEDYKIRFWDVFDIASEYTITVFRDQKTLNAYNLFEVNPEMEGLRYYRDGDKISTRAGDGWSGVEIDVSDFYILTVIYDGESYVVPYWFEDLNGNIVGNGDANHSYCRIEVPETATKLKMNYMLDQEYSVIGYK